ncbi:MAG: hypothetical protein VXZ96_00820 [Myxococcota bacterium]|nr:hypothetical protein [Myxococcota bacterium]
MSSKKSNSTLFNALEELGRWRQSESRRLVNEQAMLRRKISDVEQKIKELQAELVNLNNDLTESNSLSAGLSQEENKRGHAAILNGLAVGRAIIDERNAPYQNVVAEREAAVAQKLDEPSLKETVAEFEQFHTVEASLSALPESYRAAILKHHDQVRDALAPIFNTLSAPLPQQDLNPVTIPVVACVEENPDVDGRIQALSIILPVPASVQETWALDAPEQIGHRLAYRWVAAISGALQSVGAEVAPIIYDQYADCLSIDVWLDDSELLGDLKVAINTAYDNWTASNELQVVQCVQELIWVTPNYLSLEEGE